MHGVERRLKRSPGPRTRALLLLCLLAAIIILFLWLDPFGWTAKPNPVISGETDTGKLLFSAQREDLRSFTITPRGGEPYTIEHKGEGFVLQGDADYPLDRVMIDNMVDAIVYLEVSDTVTDLGQGQADLAPYGLLDGALHVSAQFASDARISFTIGNRAPYEAPRDYIMVTGDTLLYLIPADVREALDYRLNMIHTVPDINFTPDLLDMLTITGNTSLTLRRLTQDLWEITEPLQYPADKGKIDQMLQQVSGMRLAAYVAPADEGSLRSFGLDQPRYRVQMHLPQSVISSYPDGAAEPVVSQVAAQVMTFLIGDAIEPLGFYCLYNGAVYQASDLSMGFMLNTAVDDYLSGAPVDVPLGLVTGLTLNWAQESRSYEISLYEHILPNNEIALDEEGRTLYDYLVMQEGEEIPATPLVSFYAKLMGIRAAGSLPDYYAVTGNAVLSVNLRFLGQQRQIDFFPYDALHMAVAVNGRALHYVKSAAVMSAIDAVSAIAE
ncbi:MAG: DUF4340 domain-containing protein [Christensenellales bacterium]